MGRMAGAAGNLEPVSDHLESPFLILQMFHDDAKVLCHCPHLVIKMLLQLLFSFFRRGGSSAQLRSNDPILIKVLGGIPHYHILPFSVWDDFVVDGVWDFEGFFMMLQGSNHKGSNIRLDVSVQVDQFGHRHPTSKTSSNIQHHGPQCSITIYISLESSHINTWGGRVA